MKIHIVQKGDTLWEISQQYGVDFEELKQLNSQISSPDMIMPGMKIKIPGSTKAVKQTQMQHKPKEQVKTPYKDVSPKPLPVIKEDDKEKQKMMKPEMPVHQMPSMPAQPMMQMPVMEQEFQNYTTINFPQMHMPKQPEPKPAKKEEPKKEKPHVKPMPQPQVPMVPLCCYVMDPCYPPVPFQMMGPAPQGYYGAPHHGYPMPQVQGAMYGQDKDCGCGGSGSHEMYRNPEYQVPPQSQQPTSQSPNLYPPLGQEMYQSPHPMPPGYMPYANLNNQSANGNSQGE